MKDFKNPLIDRLTKKDAKEKYVYLGDSLYASYDGYNIWIAVNHHSNNVACLEPQVLEEFLQYAEKIKSLIK